MFIKFLPIEGVALGDSLCIAIFDGHKSLKMEESENRAFPIPSRKSPRMGFRDTLQSGRGLALR
ncbi:MAG: hypothetical protein AXA67_13875 [Methylothermaceae bacteria B42]|nr:MAG: hypothetical protein AXA67_13875 [Methylothermaceae bacteria B42]